MFRVKTSICLSVLAVLLGACAFIDTVEPRYDVVNRSTAKARNESILLNIIRASHSAPLNFVAFTRVSGTNTIGAGAGLPTFNVGQFFPLFSATLGAAGGGQTTPLAPPSPQRAFGLSDRVLNGSASANTTYDIGILETQDFYLGLLKPVDLAVVNFFIRQGYSRELLFWLFADAVRETIMGQTYEFLNDPNPDLACQNVQGVQRCFSDMIDVAMATGLTVETQVVDKGSSPAAPKAGGTPKTSGPKTSEDTDIDTTTGEAKGKKPPAKGGEKKVPTQVVEVQVSTKSESGGGGKKEYARFCFDDVLAARALREYGPDIARIVVPGSRSPRCKSPGWDLTTPQTDTLIFTFSGTPYGTIRYEIIPRSAYGIYQWLGHILALHQQETVRLRRSLYAPTDDLRILAVETKGSGGCLVDVNFEDEYYCVPAHGAQQTKRIMGLLAQLIAINTNTKDLAITPATRVIQ